MNYVYILKSEKDSHLYIGQTNDLNEKLKRHETGSVKSTKNRRPLTLIYSEEFGSRSEAVRRESYLKKLKGGTGLKKIIGNVMIKQ
ncbi:GIY-YIG nuclease family protein [Patescibacteria group bacterium]|nr:GIY-YIG nuclease family protein [Patescibacteria group bacterium]MBU1015876.1 GIY-YIG nuclease family protein [Patescibacteria group bacterium]MBU1684745.1 GIY-YIG nuclease family protein [Patescibacteria group bacterium]MBU1938889.1 GIY-YIG nuclease family protein [Patescibacteria group bacterium]